MVLCERRNRRYFDEKLIRYLGEKKNDEVRRILEDYQPSEASLTVSHFRDGCQATLLHYAIQYENEEIAKQLIASGSEIDARDNMGRTPLVYAAMQDQKTVVEALLKANADIHVVNTFGRSAFEEILRFRPESAETVEILFQHGLLEKDGDPGAFVGQLRQNGITLNQFACLRNRRFIRLLLDHGHSANEKDSYGYGRTALHDAVAITNLDMVKVLVLEYDADVDVLDNAEYTPLSHLHGFKGDGEALEILTILLSRMTALLTAINGNHRMQVSSVLMSGCKDAVNLVLQRLDDLHARDEEGGSAVHYLALNKNARAIELLRGREFDVNARNNDGITPLHLAAESHLPHAVKFLLENGAVFRARNSADNTPLHGVFQTLKLYPTFEVDSEGARECIRLLLECGLEPSVLRLNDTFAFVSKYRDRMASATGREKESKDILTLMEPIIAHLAVDKARGINSGVFNVELRASWVEYFDMCERQVKQMKTTTIYGNVSLFEFLTERQKKLTALVRNEEFVAELRRIIESFEVDSPYRSLLQSRLTRATRLAELKEESILAICRLINYRAGAFYFIAENIVDYLSGADMKNFNRAVQFDRDTNKNRL